MLPINNEELNVDDRRKTILEILKNDGKVKVVELSKLFNISDVTIRNDLSELEQAGMLQRVHGGAISTRKTYYNMSLNDRMNVNKEEKRQIAKVVASMVSEGDTLMLDSGTTTSIVAKELAHIKGITIVTNALQVAQELSYQDNINVILLGGNLDARYQFTYGADAINQLVKYKADKMIIATDGVSAKEGLTTYHYLEAEVSRHMIKRANKIIAVADYSKIGREGFNYIGPIDSIDVLVTNKNADNKVELEKIKQKGILVKEA